MFQRSFARAVGGILISLAFLVMPKALAADAWLPMTPGATTNPGIMSLLPSSQIESHSVASFGSDMYVAVSAGGDVYVSKWDGTEWMSPATGDTSTPYDLVSSHTGGKYNVNMAIDSMGRVYVVWRDAGVAPYGIQITRLNSGVWENPSTSTPGEQTITTTYSPYASFAIAIDSSNRPIVAWDNRYATMEGPDTAERNNILLTRFTGSGWSDPTGCCGVFSNVSGVNPASNEARYPSIATNGTQMIVAYSVNDREVYITQNGGTSYWATFNFAMPGNHLVDNLSQFVPKQVKVIRAAGDNYVIWVRNNELVMSRIDGFGTTNAPIAGDVSYSVLPEGANPFISSVSVAQKDANSFYISWFKGGPGDVYVTEFDALNMQFEKPSDGTVGSADNISNNASDSYGAGAGKTGEHVASVNGAPISIWLDDAGRMFPEANLFGASLQDIGTCGDGLQNIIEQCDDGNNDNGDGCSSMCMLESPTNILLGLPANGTTVSSQPVFEVSADDGHGDDLQFRISLSLYRDCSNPSYVFDQTLDTNGWAASFFAAGSTGEYTLASPLPFGPYYWCAQAIDTSVLNPGTGSDTWSPLSASQNFYVDAPENPMAPLAPGSVSGAGLGAADTFSAKRFSDGRRMLIVKSGIQIHASIIDEDGTQRKLSDGTVGTDILPTQSFFAFGPQLVITSDDIPYVFWDDNNKLVVSRYDSVLHQWENPVTDAPGVLELNAHLGMGGNTVNGRHITQDDQGNMALTFTSGSPRHLYSTVWDASIQDFKNPLTGSTVARASQLTTTDNMNYHTPTAIYNRGELYVFWSNLSLSDQVLYAKADTATEQWIDPLTNNPTTNGASLLVPSFGMVSLISPVEMADEDIVLGVMNGSDFGFIRLDTDTEVWGDLEENPGAISMLAFPPDMHLQFELGVTSQDELVVVMNTFESGIYDIYAALYDGAWKRLDRVGTDAYQAISDFDRVEQSPVLTLYGPEDELDIMWMQDYSQIYGRTIVLNPAIIPGPVCGNNIVEAGEICDGTDLAGNMCSMHGFTGGVLTCASNCQSFVTTQCTNTPVTPLPPVFTGGSGGGGYISSYTDPNTPSHSAPSNTNTNAPQSSKPETSQTDLLKPLVFAKNDTTDALTSDSPWYSAFEWGTDASVAQDRFAVTGSGTIQDSSLKRGVLPTRVRSCSFGGELLSGEDALFHFNDIQNHWAKNDIEVLAASGVIVGIDSSRFMPDEPVTRAQLAKMLLSMFCYRLPETILSSPFADVPMDVWYTVPVATARAFKIVTGYLSDGTLKEILFRPDITVSRAEAVAMVLRAAKVPAEYIETATAEVPHDVEQDRWYTQYISYALEHGLVQKGDAFHPDAPMTRAEVARLIMNYARIMK